MGNGPKTGRGAGLCSGSGVPGFKSSESPLGMNRANGRGLGRGLGRDLANGLGRRISGLKKGNS